MSFVRKYQYILSISLLFFGFARSDVSVNQSDDSGCLIEFSLTDFTVDTIQSQDQTYRRISYSGGGYGSEPGSPQIPRSVLTVAIPPTGSADVTVIPGEVETLTDIRVLPVPFFERMDNMSVEVYSEGESYSQPGFQPKVRWEVSNPIQMGPYRVLKITLNPVQVDPTTKELMVIRSMIVQIRFDSPQLASQTKHPKLVNESFYRSILLNYNQARNWRVERRVISSRKSLTSSGPWYKIPVTEEGLYKVTGSFLSDNGIDIESIDPQTLKIYNNGGRVLPQDLSVTRPDSLVENPILLSGTEDGSFDASDYLLFYGKGITGWEWREDDESFRHYINLFTDENVYWLTFNDEIPGQRISYASAISGAGTQVFTSFQDRLFYEQDMVNTENGGIHWVGQNLTADLPSRSYDFTMTDLIEGDPIEITLQFFSHMLIRHAFSISLNDNPLTTVSINSYRYMDFSASTFSSGESGQNTLTIDYSGSSTISEAYVNWFEVVYSRDLHLSDDRLRFTSPFPIGTYTYQLSGFSGETLVLDVTDPALIHRMRLTEEGSVHTFTDAVTDSTPRLYYAANSAAYRSPSNLEFVERTNLRDPSNAADLIIITHKDFKDQAEQLKVHKESTDSLSVLVVDIQDVFNEFSWGLYDPTAIRDFMKTAVETWSVPPSYLLLFGDGDYDYRNILSSSDENWIPPYETGGYEDRARATDDWYTYVPDAMAQSQHVMAMAVGRIPVQTEEEAEIVVRKISQYESGSDKGAWRNLVTITSDDEITPSTQSEWTHLTASIDLAEKVIGPLYNLKKIYLSEYPTESTIQGPRKPKAAEALIDQINRGTLFVNYIGHGNEDLWAHEWTFVRDRDMSSLYNVSRHPIFYAATCRFGWYDNIQKSSFAEDLITSEGKGAIAVIAASRDCYADANENLNAKTVERLLGEDSQPIRIGDALRAAKESYVEQYINNQKYHILGDPTMMIGSPRESVQITRVDPDVLSALGTVTVEGAVEQNGVVRTDFNGHVTLQVYDAEKTSTYKNRTYKLPGNTLFRGDAAVQNGRFESAFIVPKDISYGSNTGRISLYAWGDETDGTFLSGGMVSGIPELLAEIEYDSTGINLTGDIGHKLMLTLNDETVDVTEYFNYNEGSYLKGRIQYTFPDLAEQRYSLQLKAWDNANNSSTESIEFEYVPSGRLQIEEVLNYPNPMQTSTHFTFRINRDAEVEIKIYTISGRQIRHLTGYLVMPGFNMIVWNGRDVTGDALANGIYLYKVIANTYEGDRKIQTSEIGRLMVMQ